ncbi:MAG: bifunctional folylpolyglutamate synthase/dihydrofolate synthase [Prevotellaceae bacterium]|jgi:dihydrofolate synthase/folylpolyglutamate synthase|nr:bifunctional folylpolyglutamate synthase/dihydrofolate synthase [Prevotellaceae bacterium]
MNYKQTLDWLFSQLPMFHRVGKAAYKADLENTLKLDEYFEHPHRKFKSIHVAGTNGKGSVSHMLAAILRQAGYKVGLYTSPHLRDFRERIKVNGEMISENEVVNFVEKHHSFFEKIQPSFFEMTVALAFDYFARQQIDIAVVEVGMGGRLDSTNIITPLLSVITNIGLDHTDFLGKTIAEIAGEKAGIIKPDIPVVIGEWNEESAKVFEEKARKKNAPIVFADKQLNATSTSNQTGRQCFDIAFPPSFSFQTKNYRIDMNGSYQRKNLLTVLAAADILVKNRSVRISENNLSEGLANAAKTTGLMGRWQIVSNKPTIILDTGHNAHGFEQSMQQLEQQPREKLYFIIGVMSDKDLRSILPLMPKDAYYIYTKADLPRAMNADLLAEKCSAYGLHGEAVTPVSLAFEKAKSMAAENGIIFIGGSTFVVAEVV